MPRSIHEKIWVRLERNGTAPAGFTWQGRRYAVRAVTACWKAVGPWWDGDGERTVFRVVAGGEEGLRGGQWSMNSAQWEIAGSLRPDAQASTGIYELCYDHEGERWLLETVED
jgi:hypothetical protein